MKNNNAIARKAAKAKQRKASIAKHLGVNGKRKPKPISLEPAMDGLEQNSPLTQDQIMRLNISLASNIDVMSRGIGSFDVRKVSLDGIISAINVCLVLEDSGIYTGKLDQIKRAEIAVKDAIARANRGLGLGFDGAGLQAVRDVAIVYDEMCQQCTYGKWLSVLKSVLEKLKQVPASERIELKNLEK